MPNDINVLGSSGYQPTPAQIARVRSFLKTVPAKKTPDTVVIVPADKFANVAKTLVGHGDTNLAFSLPQTGRVYINSDAFSANPPKNEHYNGPNLPEFLMGHELAHFNNPMPLDQQEDQEIEQTKEGLPNEFDQKSQDYLKQWRKNKGDVYSNSQQQIASERNEFSATPYSLAHGLRQ